MASSNQIENEELRRRCAALMQQGWKQVGITQALGQIQGWISCTLTKYRQQSQDLTDQ